MTTPTTVSVRLQLRADTAANWTSANPTLLANELGRETDTGKIKIGDGSTAWSSLAYQAWATLPIAVASGGTGQTSYTNGQLLIGNTTGNTLTKATLTAGSGIAITNGTGSITVAASGISDAQIAADAEIAVSKLADGTARQLLQTDAAGTGVEWASNIDIPGTLDVTSAATFDSTIGASAGTASLPSITFTGDLNTGLWSPTADTIAASTAGSERFRITSAGLVGIGTSSPIYKLDVSVATNDPTTGSPATGSFVQVAGGTTTVGNGPSIALSNASGAKETFWRMSAVTVSGNNGDLVFNGYNGGANYPERLRITAAGNVGIGTTSPGANLEIKAASIPVVRLNQADTYYAPIKLAGNDLEIRGSSGTIQFYNGANDGDSSTEKMRIDGSGRLLVGTSSDSGGALLQVNGDRIRVGTAKTPASATATGTAGEICWDTSYIYVCTAANTWKRAALSTW